MKATRRTQAERTRLTQEKLVRGAIDLLKKKRYAGFRIAEVAELAGVSKGAQTHHFASKDALVLQALEQIYQDTQHAALARLAAAQQVAAQQPAVLLDALVADSEAFFLGDDFLVSLDLIMIDPDSPLGNGVKQLAQQYRLPVEQAWLDALRAAGYAALPAEEVVRLTYAIARGFGIRKLMTGSEAGFAQLMSSWKQTAAALLAGGAVTKEIGRAP
ncbi:MAG: TetR/AcrR family transcriptional regulator [Janthinobacterium lividum]